MTNILAPGMQGKTVLITGATGGIGLYTARELARSGANILMHGRSSERGRAAIDAIKRDVPDAMITFLQADLSSLAQVHNLAVDALQQAPRLDVLINNAGIVQDRRSVTTDGFETTLAVNHLAPFYLTHLLQDRLKVSAPSRVITVASNAHKGMNIKFDDLHAERSYSGGIVYSRSKLANVLFALELARRLEGTGVTSNCVHPGAVRSGFARGENGMVGLTYKLFGRFFLSPEAGAQTSVHVASAPDLAEVTGQYFAKCRPVPPSRQARDRSVAKRLWDETEAMLDL
jgi:retinol dehydrogenase 12